jgi:PAS domain S-box-containing protein
MMLETDGRFVVVAHAADGDEGIEAAAREQPDVVLLDIEMPRMDGWEALPRIMEVAPDAAVVIFSGEDNPVAARRTAIERGARGHLQKGLEARRLARQLVEEIGGALQTSADGGAATALPLVPDESSDVALSRLAAIVAASDDAIIARRLDGTILSWSPGAERIFGYTADEIVGTKAGPLLSDDDTAALRDVLERVERGEEVRLEAARTRKDGVVVDVALAASPVRDGAGAVVGASIIERSLGDRDRRDRALARAIAQLDRQNRILLRANEELDRFAYVASHDLAQPLQVMYGYVELLQMEYGAGLDPTAADWLRLVATNLERMRRLVRDLLQFARLGAAAPARGPVDCNDVLGDALSGLGSAISERNAVVSADPLPVVEGDRTQICQIFQNIIANAIKHTPADRTPMVHVSAAAVGELTRIDVDDNGAGVRPEDRTRIFEMFQRATTDADGSGLGLAISKRVVEQHGGDIWVEDAPERGGSRFSFTLRPAR